MSTFWYTKPTMRALYGEDYQAFTLFSPTHIAWLTVWAVAAVALFFFYRRATKVVRRRVLVALMVLLLADEVLKYVGTIATGQWEWGYLPLHICSLNLLVCLWYTLRPTPLAAEILYGVCLPGAAIALLCPNWLVLPVWNFMHLHSETIHLLLFLYALMLLAGGFRPDWRRIPEVLACLGCVAVPIYFLNHVLGTNFFFLNGAGDNAVTNFFSAVFGARWYGVGYVFLVLALIAVLYLPWALADRQRGNLPAMSIPSYKGRRR